VSQVAGRDAVGIVDLSKDGFDGILAPLAAEIAPDAMYDEVLATQHASA
jgi:hypothetical protein